MHDDVVVQQVGGDEDSSMVILNVDFSRAQLDCFAINL
jgi:hypothetical protein